MGTGTGPGTGPGTGTGTGPGTGTGTGPGPGPGTGTGTGTGTGPGPGTGYGLPMEADVMRFRGIDHCDTHFGFPAGNCARCIAGPVMDVPAAGSVKRMKPRTSLEDVRSRRMHEAAALQRVRDREISGEGIGESPWDGIEFESLLSQDEDLEGT